MLLGAGKETRAECQRCILSSTHGHGARSCLTGAEVEWPAAPRGWVGQGLVVSSHAGVGVCGWHVPNVPSCPCLWGAVTVGVA